MSEKKVITNDIKSKMIFQNPVLCCQFLRNYVDHPLLKNICPEDIEDCTERYTPYFGVEFEADTVKKIHLHDEEQKVSELYLISLIEHKSEVDYNVIVQLLKYMVCIWTEYEKQFGAEHKERVKKKTFRYPSILPVVYHEGKGRWTAPMYLRERIFMNEIFEEYIPNFTYCLVNNRDYSNEELLKRSDEMSLIMLLNKIQNSADLSRFLKVSPEEINGIVRKSPEAVVDIIAMVIQVLCAKLNVSKEDTEECVKKVRARDMGYLWENMEKIDVQGTYEMYLKTKAELEEAKLRAEEELAEVKAHAEEELAEVKAHAEEELAEVKAHAEELLEAKVRAEAMLAEESVKAAAQFADMQAEITRLKRLLEANDIDMKNKIAGQ